jgi:hypothetical protein
MINWRIRLFITASVLGLHLRHTMFRGKIEPLSPLTSNVIATRRRTMPLQLKR